MRVSKRILIAGCGIAALAVAAVPAIAGHGKAGLWDVTVTLDMAGMPNMPDMSKLPPQAQAAMRARGVTMGGHTVTAQHCMTQAQVDANGPPPMRQQRKECTVSNMKTGPGTYSADMTCAGNVTGTGHIQVSWDSPEHYAGKTTISGTTSNGHPFSSTTSFEGHWVGADCKGITN
ncbi:MAG TPA: DUF3617 domain-containing protein [Rhizomicrobium sp.]|nr:DUF3617 domain-containing protein [Rhizomicrobium sp.]